MVEDQARAADTLRGLDTNLSLDDMRHYGERMDRAAMPSQSEMLDYYAQEAARMREFFEEI